MKSRHLLLLAAISQIVLTTALHAQTISGDVLGEVKEFTESSPDLQKTNTDYYRNTHLESERNNQSVNEPNINQQNGNTRQATQPNEGYAQPRNQATQSNSNYTQPGSQATQSNAGHAQPSNQATQSNSNHSQQSYQAAQPNAGYDQSNSTVRAQSESTNLPGSEANVQPQSYTTTQAIDARGNISHEHNATSNANQRPLTPQQKRAKIQGLNRSTSDVAPTASLAPRNRVHESSKFSVYAQFGIQDQKLEGLNLILASKYYPSAGSYSYRAEVGTLYSASDENTFDFGVHYEIMNGLEKSQRLNRPSAGQVTESQSILWLVGIQSGVDHSLFHDSEWSVAVGLGVRADVGGLHLTERAQNTLTTSLADPSIPTPDVVSVVHYHISNISVTPRLTLRSPDMGTGWRFQARIGYQFGENVLLRVNQFSSIRNDLFYNPSGVNASVGFVAPLPRLFCN